MNRLDEDPALGAAARVNTRENVRLTFDHKLEDVVQQIVDSNFKLYKRITSKDPEERMPLKADPLPPREVELLAAWIDQGLPWQEGFSFKVATYVAALKPRLAFIVDIRRGNLDQQLFYKAMIEMSSDRMDFLSRLFGRAKPGALVENGTGLSAATLFDAFADVDADPAMVE